MSAQTGNCAAPVEPRVKAMQRHKAKHRYVVEVKWNERDPQYSMLSRLLYPDWRRYSKAHKLEDAERTRDKILRVSPYYLVRIRPL